MNLFVLLQALIMLTTSFVIESVLLSIKYGITVAELDFLSELYQISKHQVNNTFPISFT